MKTTTISIIEYIDLLEYKIAGIKSVINNPACSKEFANQAIEELTECNSKLDELKELIQ